MQPKSRISLLILTAFFATLLTAPAYGSSLNKSITVNADETSEGQSSLNGSITVGKNARIDGSLETVNGSIRIADGVQVEDVETVNGSIRIADKVSARNLLTVNGSVTVGEGGGISGDVSAVNGKIGLKDGTKVGGAVTTVNGALDFNGATISGDASTVNGDVTLADKTVIEGDLVIEKPDRSFWNWSDSSRHLPVVTIGPGSRVDGTIVLNRKVKLFISETASVGAVSGEMTMEDAVRFKGKRP